MVSVDQFGTALTQGWVWPAYCFLAVIGLAASWVDGTTGRIPNRLTLPSYPILIGLLAWPAIAQRQAEPFVRALWGGVGLLMLYLVLAWLAAGQMGLGDVKLAGLLGMGLAHIAWPALAIGTLAGFTLGGLAGLVLVVRGQGVHQRFPFGPWMCLGALLGGALGVTGA